MKEHQQVLIDYRLTEARESLAEAKVLLREKMSNRAIMNRLYYAMFYTVLAILQTKRIGISKHAGVISTFDREFVKWQLNFCALLKFFLRHKRHKDN